MVPTAALDNGFIAQEGTDTFPIFMARHSKFGFARQHVVNPKFRPGKQCFSSLALTCLGFNRVALKCDNYRANGLAEVAVREVQRQCPTLRIVGEMKAGRRIPDDHPLPS